MSDTKETIETTSHDLSSGVMPRFFVDERVGCIAIRDTQHPEFDVEYQGLDCELPDVVKFEIGTLINNEWVVSEEIIENFKSECASLNGA